jgi:hypothetical protein
MLSLVLYKIALVSRCDATLRHYLAMFGILPPPPQQPTESQRSIAHFARFSIHGTFRRERTLLSVSSPSFAQKKVHYANKIFAQAWASIRRAVQAPGFLATICSEPSRRQDSLPQYVASRPNARIPCHNMQQAVQAPGFLATMCSEPSRRQDSLPQYAANRPVARIPCHNM